MSLSYEDQLEKKIFTSSKERLSLDLLVLVHQQILPIDYFCDNTHALSFHKVLYTNSKSVPSKHTEISKPLQVLYTNCDKFLNKFDELLTIVGNDKPDLILLTEVIPKARPIGVFRISIAGYHLFTNFDADLSDRGKVVVEELPSKWLNVCILFRFSIQVVPMSICGLMFLWVIMKTYLLVHVTSTVVHHRISLLVLMICATFLIKCSTT